MRFIPLIRDLVRRLAENEIGEVKMLQADFGFRAPLDPSSRLFNLDLGGGALLDIGIYPLAFATLLLGELEEITSVAHKTTTQGLMSNRPTYCVTPRAKLASWRQRCAHKPR